MLGLNDVDAVDLPIANVVGETVALGPLHRGLVPLLTRWDNDFATADLRGNLPQPCSPEAIAAAWEPLIRGERPDWIGFAIYQLPGWRPIGVANIRDYLNPWGTAEFGIAIGEADARGRGHGTEATRLRSTTPSPTSASTTSGSIPWPRTRPPSAPTPGPGSRRSVGGVRPTASATAGSTSC